MRLFDSHCHIQDDAFRDDRDVIMRQAADAGVHRMLCCGVEESDWAVVIELAQKYPTLKPALGLHPVCAAGATKGWLDRLREKLLAVPGAAVGEIGLDEGVETPDMATQEQMLFDQLRLACEMRRPVSLHCRRAWGRLSELLRRARLPERGLVIHSYSGSPQMVAELASMGPVYFSFSGAITRPTNKRGRAALCCVPPDRLMIETDAPDIPPVLEDGSESARPNEPSRLVVVARAIAGTLGKSLEDVAVTTWDNASRVFGD